MTTVQFYARLLALLQESGLSKAEKIELLEHAVEFVHEEAAVKAIWETEAAKESTREEVNAAGLTCAHQAETTAGCQTDLAAPKHIRRSSVFVLSISQLSHFNRKKSLDRPGVRSRIVAMETRTRFAFLP